MPIYSKFEIRELIIVDAPHSIREELLKGTVYAQYFADSMKESIIDSYGHLAGETLKAEKTGITSDHLSSAVCQYIKEIHALSKMPSGLELAFELLVYLGQHSYAELSGKGCGVGNRPSDRPADSLLVNLAKEMKAKDPEWYPQGVLDRLQAERKILAGYGIETYFPRSCQLIETYCLSQTNVVKRECET